MKKILIALLVFPTLVSLAGDPDPQQESTTEDSTAIADFLSFLLEADSLNNLLKYEKAKSALVMNWQYWRFLKTLNI